MKRIQLNTSKVNKVGEQRKFYSIKIYELILFLLSSLNLLILVVFLQMKHNDLVVSYIKYIYKNFQYNVNLIFFRYF